MYASGIASGSSRDNNNASGVRATDAAADAAAGNIGNADNTGTAVGTVGDTADPASEVLLPML
jgi:hypothetical protein